MSTKEKVLEALLKSENEYLSGGRLARNLGISRNAVWKAVKSLQNEGYVIRGINNKGYMITEIPDILSSDEISKYLKEYSIQAEPVVIDITDSTNTYAKKLAEDGAEHFTAVFANEQTAGRGRLGRTFCSPKNTGIYMSIILKNDLDLEISQFLTAYTAVAAAEAVENLYKRKIMIKWVNDLMLNSKKICGILTEASISCETSGFNYIIVGIGINTGSVKDIFDSELLKTASSLEDETGIKIRRSQTAAAILASFIKNYHRLSDRSFLENYKSRSWITGKKVIVTVDGTEREAIASGIDDSCRLIVRFPDKTTARLNSGEARLPK